MARGKQRNADDLGIVAPQKKAVFPLSVRLSDDDMRKLGVDPEFDLSSTFDVPAFLRRQEG